MGIDASAGMLDQARAKSWPPGVSFEVGMAEELAFARESWGLGDRVPGVFAAYLFRNVTERDKVLAAVYDLLDDDGTLVVQEYSVAGSRLAAAVWSLVCWTVVIPLSWLTSRQTRLYRYLWRSVLRLRLGAGLRRPAVRCRFRRRRGAYGARLAARHPAHLPRPQAGRRPPAHDADRWRPGRDARAVRHPAAWTSAARGCDLRPSKGPVLVAGGGIAGIAAAVGLAERGVPVILVEPQPQLGGRVRAWPVDHGG